MESRVTWVKSHRRRDGTAVAAHQRTVPDARHETAHRPGPAFHTASTVRRPPSFPDPAYVPKRPNWFRRRLNATSREKFIETITYTLGGPSFENTYWRSVSLGRKGYGSINLTKSHIDNYATGTDSTQRLAPGEKLRDEFMLRATDLSHANLSGMTIAAKKIYATLLVRATIRGATFSTNPDQYESPQELRDVVFDGADLAGTTFDQCAFSGVSFRGANLTDVTFTPRNNNFTRNRESGSFVVDFTDSNVTAEQFDTFTAMGSQKILIRRHTFDEFVELTGENPDMAATLLWAGDIEYRDRDTDKQSDEPFDRDRHYIPQWVTQTYQP